MRRTTLIPIAVGAVSITALGLASAVEFAPRIVWNASASAPIGLYRIEKRPPKISDFVLVKPDAVLEEFITDRDYLPPEVPLLKRVAALSGARICREESAIFIDGRHVADALFIDSLGREMPVWNGCFTLKAGECFLLNVPEKSLDGRYFGTTNASEIVGVATPVWVSTDVPNYAPS
ncbi:MAG: S26 family signal peptidase [Pseudomonadota bacterium]